MIGTSYFIAIFKLDNRIKPFQAVELPKLTFQFIAYSPHYHIGIMTKSFPVHVTCGRILLVKCFEPDINRLYLRWLEFAGFT